MQMTENDKSLLGIMTSILMLRTQGHPAYHVEVNESMLDALRVLARMKNPETRLASFIHGDEIIDLLNEAFPDPEEPQRVKHEMTSYQKKMMLINDDLDDQ